MNNDTDFVFNFETIEWAFEYANINGGGNEVVLDRRGGKPICIEGFGDTDPVPDDIDDDSRYLMMPDKRDLGLGTDLVYRFIDAKASHLYDETRAAFSQRGAYRRFKALMESHGLIDSWHQFETEAEKTALLNWCQENNIPLSAPSSS